MTTRRPERSVHEISGLEQSGQLLPRGFGFAGSPGLSLALPELEGITEVARRPVADRLGADLAALVVGRRIVKPTVEAAVKRRGTGRTLSGSPDPTLKMNLGLALVTVVHEAMLAVKLARSPSPGSRP